MKHKSYDDEQLKKILNKLPPVEDRKSKEETYQAISSRINEPKKKKVASWVIPSLASAAVLLILAIVIPFYLNSDNQTASDSAESSSESIRQQKDSSADTVSEEAGESATINKQNQTSPDSRENSGSSESSSEFPTLKDENKSETESTDSAKIADTSEPNINSHVVQNRHKGMVTTVLAGRNAQVIVPLTIVTDGELTTMEESLSDQSGLAENLIDKLEIQINGSKAMVTFPDDFSSYGGEAMAQAIIESIKWKVYPDRVSLIKLQTESGGPVKLGAYGELDQITPVKEGGYIYQIYQYNADSMKLLTPVRMSGEPTIEEAVHQLNKNQNMEYVSPAVPDHVQFPSIRDKGDTLVLQMNHGEWSNTQELGTTVEAILMTAKQFGFLQVKIEGAGESNVGDYNLNRSLDVPDSINPIVLDSDKTSK